MHRRSLLRQLTLSPWSATLLAACAIGSAQARPKRRPEGSLPDAEPGTVAYRGRADVVEFALEAAQRHDFDSAWARHTLAQARRIPSVERLIVPVPGSTEKNWAAYRARAIDSVRIRAGLAFWNANKGWLRKADQRWGVPPEIVVGIIGIETLYGRDMGNYRTLDALATLSFDFPGGRSDRSAFFRGELESYLLWCHGAATNPLLPRGSFAGAMGMGQFMPSSVSKYALDFDANGSIDLNRSAPDVIGSVAHYLAAFGWKRGVAPRFAVKPPAETLNRELLLAPDIVPSFSTEEFIERGALLGANLTGFDGKLALVELLNGDAAPSYVAGTDNFYAITRYNASSYYALAVIELGETIARERARGVS